MLQGWGLTTYEKNNKPTMANMGTLRRGGIPWITTMVNEELFSGGNRGQQLRKKIPLETKKEKEGRLSLIE